MPPDLWLLAAEQFAPLLAEVPAGSPIAIDRVSDLCATLEYLVPQVLRQEHPEWKAESIDGFYFARAVKVGDGSAELAGACILIRDQTLTPVRLNVDLSSEKTFDSFRVRLGEPGTGALGISGPPWAAVAASFTAVEVVDRLEAIDWVYDVAIN